MNHKSKLTSLLLTAALSVAVMGTGCTSEQAPIFGQAGTSGTGTGGGTSGGTSGTTTGATTGLAVPNFTQVEELARPAIAEGLLISNSNLNTFNAVPPSFVFTALTVSGSAQATAAAPVFAEAKVIIGALVALAPTSAGLTVNGVVGAFLPDVMRIDTTLSFTPVAGTEKSAYGSALNSHGSPVGGRKLTDDVIDITLTVLTGGTVKTDGVPYYRPAGNTNQAIGHQNLNGQAAPWGPSSFPFLAPAN